MVETSGLRVSIHAVKQFLCRTEGREVPQEQWVDEIELRRCEKLIRQAIQNSVALPSDACLLFVRPRRLRQSKRLAEQREWGTYMYDGESCYVIEQDCVVTVIVPDSDQHRVLDELLARPHGPPKQPMVELISPPALSRGTPAVPQSPPLDQARMEMVRACLKAARTKVSSLHVGDIEVYWPTQVPVHPEQAAPELYAELFRWILRSMPSKVLPIQLMYSSHYEPVIHEIKTIYQQAISTVVLPSTLGKHKNVMTREQGAELLELLVPRAPYRRTFVLVTRAACHKLPALLERGMHIDCGDYMSMKPGTLLTIDLSGPEGARRASHQRLVE